MKYRYIWLFLFVLFLSVSSSRAQHTEVTIEDTQSITGPKMTSQLNNIIFVDGVTYQQSPDIGVGINAAFNSPNFKGAVYVPPGTYNYATTIKMLPGSLPSSEPIVLACPGGATLNYTGTSNAVQVGPTGLTLGTVDIHPYEIWGCTFTGGLNSTQGIDLQQYVTLTQIHDNYFYNFASVTAGHAGIYAEGNNWSLGIYNNVGWMSDNICHNFFDMANDTNTKLFIVDNHYTAGQHCSIGIRINGWAATVRGNGIASYKEGLVVGANALGADIDNNYFESFDTTGTYGCIGFESLTAASIRSNYCNLHSSDFSGNGSFIYVRPTFTTALVTATSVYGNIVYNPATTSFLVQQNSLGGQTDNQAFGNHWGVSAAPIPIAKTHQCAQATCGPWSGSDGDTPTVSWTSAPFLSNHHIYEGAGFSIFGCTDAADQCAGGPTQSFQLNSNGQIRAKVFTADQSVACTNGELALSAGWQSTGSATVTGVAGNGQTCSWTITTGTTTAANPTITDTLTVNTGLPNATTVCWMIINGGTRTAAASDGFVQTTFSATAPVFTFQGTPTAGGKTYLVTRGCGP